MRTLDITKFVKDGFQSSLKVSTNRHTWKHVCISCSIIVKKERQ